MTINISRRRAIQGAAVAALSASPMRFAFAGGMTGGALEVTQIANNVELVMQYAKQIEQYATQLQQWRDQLTQALSIPQQIWSSIQQDIMGVVNVVKQGKALAFSLEGIGEIFKAKFPGFKATTDYVSEYKQWSQTVSDTIKGTLEAAQLQSEQFATEEGVLQQLRTMSQSNQGRMQALQTGNQIAVEMVAQMQKLRALSLAQMQAQNAYMAKAEQEKDTARATLQSLIPQDNLTDTRKYEGFGLVANPK